MKRHNQILIACLLVFALFLALVLVARADGAPPRIAFHNGGFESGCDKATPSDVYDARGNFVGKQVVGEICTPLGWTVWFRRGLPVDYDPLNEIGYAQPEVKAISDMPPYDDPPRVYSGGRALQLFTFYKIHDAGLYQFVPVRPGSRWRLTAYAHAWASILDNPHSSFSPPDQATFQVGIDPTGGSDPFADSVVWGNADNIYDSYAQIPPVLATAKGAVVTVFVRSTMKWPLKHNDAYIDSVTLEPLPWMVYAPVIR